MRKFFILMMSLSALLYIGACFSGDYSLMPHGLPREPTGGGVSKEEPKTPLWSLFARVSRIGEIQSGKKYPTTCCGDFYSFSSSKKRNQFILLTQQLRCLVCQNETIADSNADLAKQLREEIYNMINKGKSEQQIKNYLASRYGDFILFKPPFNHLTYVLWMLPFVFLVSGFLILFGAIYKRRLNE